MPSTDSTTPTGQYFYACGKRKSAIARVRLYENGSGNVTINDRKFKEYFPPLERENALAPLKLTDNAATFDIVVTVTGGGTSAQSGAMRHGISRALIVFDPELRRTLKREGFLRRDARIKERKKPGLKRARRAPQFSKR
jgi:small subunit ribosomal protein S9